MIKTYKNLCNYVMKTKLETFRTGKVLQGRFGDLVETKERLVYVPDYPETNKKLLMVLNQLISEHCVDLGEIKEAKIIPAPGENAYQISVYGAYGNYYKKNIETPPEFGNDGVEKTSAYCLMEELKYIIKKRLEDYMGGENDFVKDTLNLFEVYIERAKNEEDK